MGVLTQRPDVMSSTSKLQLCDDVLQAAVQHEDIYLLAMGNHTRAFIMMSHG